MATEKQGSTELLRYAQELEIKKSTAAARFEAVKAELALVNAEIAKLDIKLIRAHIRADCW